MLIKLVSASLQSFSWSPAAEFKIFSLDDFGRKLSYYQTRDLSKVGMKPETGVS